jgi:hypothetical protein
MDSRQSDTLERVKENLFKIIYLILLVVLLAFIANKSNTTEDDAQNEIKGKQLVKENEK